MFYTISGNNITEHMDQIKSAKNIINKANIDSFKKFKLSEDYKSGGDCLSNFTSPFKRNTEITLNQCAEKCLNTPNCNRFTFGKKNVKGDNGLGCRISTNGSCPITTDDNIEKVKDNKKLDWNYKELGYNFWGGKVYDKKNDNIFESSVTSKNEVKKSSTSINIVDGKVVESTNKSVHIVDGEIVSETDEASDDSNYTIYIITAVVIIILGGSIYYLRGRNQNTN